MRKGWKVFWGISGVIAGIGVVFIILGIVMGVTFSEIRGSILHRYQDGFMSGFKKSDTSFTGSGEKQEFIGISSLEVDVDKMEVNILESDRNTIVVETLNIDERIGLKIWQEDGELNIETEEGKKRINNAGTVNIYIPSGIRLEEVSFSTGDGVLNAEKLNASEVDVSIEAGTANMDEIHADSIDFSCGVGEANASLLNANEISAECGLGAMNITLAGKKEDYNYKLECGLGSLELGGESFGGIAIDETINNGASRYVEAECGLGTLNISYEQ